MTENQVNEMPNFRYKKVYEYLKTLESKDAFLTQQLEKVTLMDQAREFQFIKKNFLRNEHFRQQEANKQQRCNYFDLKISLG